MENLDKTKTKRTIARTERMFIFVIILNVEKRVAFTILWFNSTDVIQFGRSNNSFARCTFGYRHSFRKCLIFN